MEAEPDDEAPRKKESAQQGKSQQHWLGDQAALLGCHRVAELRVHVRAVHHLQWTLKGRLLSHDTRLRKTPLFIGQAEVQQA